MTPSARNANKRKAESSPENGGDASTTTAANPSRPQRKKQKQQADESTSPAASPVAGNHGGVSSAPTGMKKHMLSLLNELQTAVDETGRLIASDFMQLPPKKRYPDYYITIKKPVALDMISARVDNDEYDDMEALKADLNLMTSNAKRYNVKESSIYQDALVLQKRVKDFPNEPQQILKVTLRQPPPAKEKQPTPPPAPPKQTAQQAQEELLLHIENLKEPRTRRKYSDIFMDAPSKKQYPEYYEFIERVICLNEIKRNVKKGVYKSWAEFEADVELVWKNAFTFNEDGSRVYEDARKLKTEFEKVLKEKKAALGEPDQHIKLKLNLQQPQQPLPSTKIKLHLLQPQKMNTPVAQSPPSSTGGAPPNLKKESPILPPQILPPRSAQHVRQGSPLKNQITASPSKTPPALRPAPPKSGTPTTTTTATTTAAKEPAAQPTDLTRPPNAQTPQLPTVRSAPPLAQTPLSRPSPSQPLPSSDVNNIHRPPPSAPQENGVRHPPSQPSPMAQILHASKKERSLTLIPLITISTPPTQLASPATSTKSSTPSASPPQPQIPQPSLFLQIPSPTPPAPATQSICLTVPHDCPELTLNAYMIKDLTLHGSYTFTVIANGRKIPPSIWPDASRRSGTTDSIAVTSKAAEAASEGGGTATLNEKEWGDHWRFGISLGEAGSITSVEAACTAFLKRDERGLLVRGEKSRTGMAAGEDGGETERVVLLVLRGR